MERGGDAFSSGPPTLCGPDHPLLSLFTLSISPFYPSSTLNLKPAINVLPASGKGSAASVRCKSVTALGFAETSAALCRNLGGAGPHSWLQGASRARLRAGKRGPGPRAGVLTAAPPGEGGHRISVLAGSLAILTQFLVVPWGNGGPYKRRGLARPSQCVTMAPQREGDSVSILFFKLCFVLFVLVSFRKHLLGRH